MKTKLQPLGDRILVQLEKPLDKTPGGILLPDMAKEKPKTGRVIALGTGAYHEGKPVEGYEFSVAVGDIVLFNKYGAEPLPDCDELILIRESDLLAKVVK